MKDIREQVVDLEVVLRAEEGLYLRLRDLLIQEESCLVALDPGEVADVVERKRALAEEARLLEDSRRVLTQALAGSLGFGDAPVRLAELIAALDDEAGGLAELQVRLAALIGATRRLLESNGHFSERSLRHVQQTLKRLGKAVIEPVGYGPRSVSTATVGRGRLVRATI